MALMLKLMSAQDLPDEDSRKRYSLYANIVTVDFVKKEDGRAWAEVLYTDGGTEDFPLYGNAYLMNENGRTVSSFGPGADACPPKFKDPVMVEKTMLVQTLALIVMFTEERGNKKWPAGLRRLFDAVYKGLEIGGGVPMEEALRQFSGD